jgi:hypothetical protein
MISDEQIRRKKIVVTLVAVALLVLLLALTPFHHGIWSAVHGSPTVVAQMMSTPPSATTTPTPTAMATDTHTPTATATATHTPTATSTPPHTLTATVTHTPTATAMATCTSTATSTPTHTLTATVTHTPTATATTIPSPEREALVAPRITAPTGEEKVLDTEVRFEGQAAANADVIVYDNGAPLGTTTADAAGRWTFVPSRVLSEAEHTIVARTTRGERVSPPSEPIQLTVISERLPTTGSGPASRAGRGLPSMLIAILIGAGVVEYRSRRRGEL